MPTVLGRGICFGLTVAAFAVPPPSWSAEPTPSEMLSQARDALDRGDAPLAALRAETWIRIFPGHPLSSDVQLLLGRAREQAGDSKSAIEQYRLFLSNFPTDPRRPEVAMRISRLARERAARVPPTRWVLVSATAALVPAPLGDERGVLLIPNVDMAMAELHLSVQRVNEVGVSVWVLVTPSPSFDLFDEAAVGLLEAQVRVMASWGIDGLVVGPGLFLPEASPAPEAARVRTEVEQAGSEDRARWAWAGMRARRAAEVLGRLVQSAQRSGPPVRWMVALSAAAVMDPLTALVRDGEDVAELALVMPDAMIAMVDPPKADHALWGQRLARLGFPNRLLMWRTDRADVSTLR